RRSCSSCGSIPWSTRLPRAETPRRAGRSEPVVRGVGGHGGQELSLRRHGRRLGPGESAVATVVVEQRAGVALGGAGFSDVREYDDVIPALHHACHGTVEPCEGVPERGEPGPRPGQGHASELVGCTAAHGGGDLV